MCPAPPKRKHAPTQAAIANDDHRIRIETSRLPIRLATRGVNQHMLVAKRKEIMRRRRAKDDYISSWFSYEPVSRPAPKPTRMLARASRTGRG